MDNASHWTVSGGVLARSGAAAALGRLDAADPDLADGSVSTCRQSRSVTTEGCEALLSWLSSNDQNPIKTGLDAGPRHSYRAPGRPLPSLATEH